MFYEKKSVVITGTSKGLGLALSRCFAANGWVVFGCCNSVKNVNSLNEEFGDTHSFSRVDVSNVDEVREWSEIINSKYGIPNLVINNAGIINTRAPAWDISSGEFGRNVSVNLIGTFVMTKVFVPLLLEEKAGCIVNVSSGWGRSASQGLAPYCATKFAVEGFTKSLALDLPPYISAYPLDPGGGINTDMLKSCLPDEYQDYPTPEQWAPLAFEFLTAGVFEYPSGTSVTVPIGE